MVTCLPCIVHKLVSLKTSTMKYSIASCRARTAVLCTRRLLFPNFSAILHTRCWKGAFLMRRSVFFWNFWISLRGTHLGRQWRGFLTAIAFCTATHAAFVAKWRHGGAPPVDLCTICLTQAMVGDVYDHGCSFWACTCPHITIVCVVTGDWETLWEKVYGRKPLPYKTAGELFIPPNLHLFTLIGKRTYIYSHLTKNEHKSE